MMFEKSAIYAFFVGDSTADKIVPSIGLTSWLIFGMAAIMSILAVFSIALMATTNRVADSWTSELQKSATVRINAAEGQLATRTASVVRVLQTTPGILRVRVLTQDENRALLEPWLGDDLPLDRLPVPQLIELSIDPETYDPMGLALRLEGEVPGTVLDDHARWRDPLIKAANRLRFFGYAALSLIGAAAVGMIILATGAALSINTQVISVSRLVGARDVYIARAFVRRLTLRSTGGAVVGSVVGALLILIVPTPTQSTALLENFGLFGFEWLWPALLPFATCVISFLASRQATFQILKAST